MMDKNNPKELFGWCMYDWANSTYSLVIATAIYPIYFNQVVPDVVQVPLLGTLDKTSLRSYAISVAYLLLVLLSPLLGGIADARNLKKTFLRAACYLGALCCVGLYFFNQHTVGLGVTLFIGASFFYALSEVFYNAFLPDIATADRYDRLSARGFSLGYIGSVILLVAALAIVLNYEKLGIGQGQATGIAFVMTGLWWAGFGSFSFSRLRQRTARPLLTKPQATATRASSLQELRGALQEVGRIPVLGRFLLTFLFYDMAVQTVMNVATDFGTREMHLATGNLIAALLLIQLIAIPGAYLFAALSRRRGNLFALRLALLVWIAICVYAYFIQSPWEFYLLGGLVGLVMGATQSVSRATFSKFLPEGQTDNSSLFSFYGLMDKLAIVLGTFTFGLVNQQTGSMRSSIIFLITWLVVGMLLLVLSPWQALLLRGAAARAALSTPQP